MYQRRTRRVRGLMEKAATVVRIERFREMAPGGNAALIQLIELFLEQMREQLPRLRDAIANNAVEDIELIAHRCAGTSATCGADAISSPLLALERLAKDGTTTDAAPLAADATAAFDRAEDFLLGYVAGLRECERDG